MNWKIGQKLVCVDSKPIVRNTDNGLIEGEIYTYAGPGHICQGSPLVDIMVGIFSTGICPNCGTVYTGYNHYLPYRFRPIVDIGDEVEEYIKSKIQEPEYA